MKPTLSAKRAGAIDALFGLAERLEIIVEKAGDLGRDKIGAGAIAALVSKSPDGGCLKLAKVLRETGKVDQAVVFFLISRGLECAFSKRMDNDPELTEISRQIARRRKAHERPEDDLWRKNEATDEVEELQAAWEKRMYEVEVRILEEWGEVEMASLLATDPEKFERRAEEGRAKILAALPPGVQS